MTTLAGIDVSNHQGTITWADWKGKVQFAFAKATEGATFKDAFFPANWAGMKAEGIVRGAYHFARPAGDPHAQAEFFLGVVKRNGLHPGDLLALDLEETDGLKPAEVAGWAQDWCHDVHTATDTRPIVYVNQNTAKGGYCFGLGLNPLWLANPSRVNVALPIGPWGLISFEQTGQRGVDTDVFYGGRAQLAQLAAPAPAPAPAPALQEGYLVVRGTGGGFTGRAVISGDGGKTWA